MDIWNSIKQIKVGSISVTPETANSTCSQTVKFDTPFLTTPRLILNPINVANPSHVRWTISSRLPDRFVLNFIPTYTIAYSFDWIAIA